MGVMYESDGMVRVITIDRSEAANAIDQATNDELRQAWHAFAEDRDARVAVLTGAGDKAFSAGADLKALDPEARRRGDTPPPLGVITRGFDMPKPTIAAINGAAYGGGLEMALACDIRVAVETARLALSEARWAVLPGAGGTQRLPRLVPTGIALEMLFTAQPIDADRAYEVGLVNRVVPVGQALDAALEIAALIARNGPLAVTAAKRAVLDGLGRDLAAGLELEQQLSKELFKTEDAAEGPKAFREKRTPNYQGR